MQAYNDVQTAREDHDLNIEHHTAMHKKLDMPNILSECALKNTVV